MGFLSEDIMGFLESNIMTLCYYPAFMSLYYLSQKIKQSPDDIYRKTYRTIERGIIYYILISGLFIVSSVGNHIWWTSSSMWVFCMLLIGWMDESIDYFVLGYASMVFLSEYYEIPIYITRLINGIFFISSDLIIIIPKLLFIVIMVFLMNRLDIGGNNYLVWIIKFSMWYIPIGTVLAYFIGGNSILYMMMRFTCIGITASFIYSAKQLKKEEIVIELD